VPSSLVGLLLSKGVKGGVTTLNEIQRFTETIVSKDVPTTTTTSTTTSTIADKGGEDGRSVGDGGNSTGVNIDKGVDDNSIVKVNDTINDDQLATTSIADNNNKKKSLRHSTDDVNFYIYGHFDENVNAVVEHITRIIAGERIKDVLVALKLKAKQLRFTTTPTSTIYYLWRWFQSYNAV